MERRCKGYLAATGIGAATSTGFSAAPIVRRLTGREKRGLVGGSRIPLTPNCLANWHTHAVASNVDRWSSFVGETHDGLIGGAGAVASEMMDLESDRGGNLVQDGINGMIRIRPGGRGERLHLRSIRIAGEGDCGGEMEDR